jgi:hypothetical protein
MGASSVYVANFQAPTVTGVGDKMDSMIFSKSTMALAWLGTPPLKLRVHFR